MTSISFVCCHLGNYGYSAASVISWQSASLSSLIVFFLKTNSMIRHGSNYFEGTIDSSVLNELILK